MKKDLSRLSLEEIERLFLWGSISEEEMIDYIKKWNDGPHVCQAFFFSGRIRLLEGEKCKLYYPQLKEKFNLHWE